MCFLVNKDDRKLSECNVGKYSEYIVSGKMTVTVQGWWWWRWWWRLRHLATVEAHSVERCGTEADCSTDPVQCRCTHGSWSYNRLTSRALRPWRTCRWCSSSSRRSTASAGDRAPRTELSCRCGACEVGGPTADECSSSWRRLLWSSVANLSVLWRHTTTRTLSSSDVSLNYR